MNEEFEYWDFVFRKHQRALLNILNTPEGRQLQGISKIYDNLPVIQVGRNHVTFRGGKKLKGIFYSGNGLGVAKVWGDALEKSLIADKGVSHYSLANYSNIYTDRYFPLIFSVVTAFTGGTKDGSMNRGTQPSWSDARDGTDATSVSNGATANDVSGVTTGGNYFVERSSMPTDTSGLTTSATIVSARQFFRNLAVTGAGDDAHMVESTISDVTVDVVDANFNDLDFTTLGSVAATSTGDKFIDLNATGLTKISKTAYTKLMLIAGKDQSNTSPSGLDYFNIAKQANATSAHRPYLEVTYTLPGGAVVGYSFII